MKIEKWPAVSHKPENIQINELDILFDLAKKAMVTFKSSVSTQKTNSDRQGIKVYMERDWNQVKDD